jgi:mannose-6-phosphate isomerase-like protein (cupin superfamily)
MKITKVLGALVSSATVTAGAKNLWLDTTPNTVMPYALLKGHGVPLGGGDTWNRFPVTGNSSGGAFCLMNTHGPGVSGGTPSLFPHVHKKTYENFYARKGRVQLWGQNLDGFLKNTTAQQTRILGPGDFGAIPTNGIHTFQMLEPDTVLTGVLVPGGFEEFFFNMATPTFDFRSLNSWDVYPQQNFTPRADAVNGIGGSGNWYNGSNTLTGNSVSPNFIAKNYGPKWLNNEHGYYQIVTPFVTGKETDNKFAQGTITMSLKKPNQTAPTVKLPYHTAFMMEEGQLSVTIEGYDPVHLIDSDVVFIPAFTPFTYYAEVEFTKFMYVSGGGDGLDAILMKGGSSYGKALYPQDQSEATAFNAPGISGPGRGPSKPGKLVNVSNLRI